MRRLEFCHTPKHDRWLNIAKNELSAMTRQCLTGRRFATVEDLAVETTAWHDLSNVKQRGVEWQFYVVDMPIKLKWESSTRTVISSRRLLDSEDVATLSRLSTFRTRRFVISHHRGENVQRFRGLLMSEQRQDQQFLGLRCGV